MDGPLSSWVNGSSQVVPLMLSLSQKGVDTYLHSLCFSLFLLELYPLSTTRKRVTIGPKHSQPQSIEAGEVSRPLIYTSVLCSASLCTEQAVTQFDFYLCHDETVP